LGTLGPGCQLAVEAGAGFPTAKAADVFALIMLDAPDAAGYAVQSCPAIRAATLEKTMSWILVVVTIAGLSIGQVLFKLGAMRVNADAQGGVMAWLNVPIVIAIVVYAVCTLMWIGALRALPLRVAYPVVALSYLLVPLLGHLFLREPLTTRTVLGGVIIIVGVIIASSSE
jgi:undecaprenyl phosphate-alpha-L-ara4N flippase subunit ArnE